MQTKSSLCNKEKQQTASLASSIESISLYRKIKSNATEDDVREFREKLIKIF